MDREELHRIRKYTLKSEIDKAIHTLEGILKGILFDSIINKDEIDEIKTWCGKYYDLANRQPFKDLYHLLLSSIKDNKITEEEYNDLKWFCNKVNTGSVYYDIITSDIQRLEGIIHGILADGKINNDEIKSLEKWLFENEQLNSNYPYDEICSLVVGILTDGKIDEEEEKILTAYFSDFINLTDAAHLDPTLISEYKKTYKVSGICALAPEIIFKGNIFCFTGISQKVNRNTFAEIINKRGGIFKNNLIDSSNYLIIGADGNPCWAYSCYGRKVEKAMELRKTGSNILIIHENDFWDA
ncbi:MAG: NAD-dependent DNA ligase, partial [Candidatus Fischerbacteria bacterium RBG_13_37_8]